MYVGRFRTYTPVGTGVMWGQESCVNRIYVWTAVMWGQES